MAKISPNYTNSPMPLFPLLLGEDVPAKNTPMIQANMVSSTWKEYLSLGTGEVGEIKVDSKKPNQTTTNLSPFPNSWSYIF